MILSAKPSAQALFILALLFFAPMLQGEPPPGYRLAWADEFDGAELDLTKWTHWLPGVRRDATNVPEAATVQDGLLTIATYTEDGRHFTGMISTEGRFEARYGYWEARIEWADAPGTWSAFWSQTPTIGVPLGDVAAAGMEIDFVEHREVDEEGRRIAAKANFTLHWDGYGPEHQGKGHQTPDLKLDQGFHVYGFEWTETAYRFFIDGQLHWEVTEPISQRSQFVILSSEVESGAWSRTIPKEGYGGRSTSKTRLKVDYVRYYEKP